MNIVAKLFCIVLLVVLSDGREMVKMDFDWKFLPIFDSNLPVCPPNTFPIDMNGVQCSGLTQITAANNLEMCSRECCSDPGCETYQWCGQAGCSPLNSCWIGKRVGCQSSSAWQSRGRNVSAPVTKCNDPYCMPSYDDNGWRTLDVPHDFIVEGVFNQTAEAGHGFLPKGKGWYRKHFTVPDTVKGQVVWFYFEGVYRNSVVYLNGEVLGNHPSGYTSFFFPATNLIYGGGDNVLVVSVDARSDEGWWYEGGGIYRHVWMNTADPLHVVPWGVYVPSTVTGSLSYPESGPISSGASVTIKTSIINQYTTAASFTLETQIREFKSGTVVGQVSSNGNLNAGQSDTITQTITLTNVSLWDTTSPFLYEAVSSISSKNAQLDQVETRFGIRTIEFNKDTGFWLNGRSVKIKGFCNHQDFAGVGIALPRRINEFRVAKLQEMGANGWRMSHNPPNPELLDITDEMGMLVWDENRNFGDDPQYQSDVATLPLRDRNHPSIIIWSLCNEGGCQEGANDANALRIANLLKGIIRTYDDTRPVSGAWNAGLNDLLYGWGPKVMDLQGVNYNYGELDPYHKQYPNKPMIASETASCTGARGIYVTNDAVAHKSIFSADGCAQEWWTSDASRQFMAGGFAWTGFDYKGEPTPYGWPCVNSNFGVIDIAGFPKDTFWYYQSWWISEPVLHLFPHWNSPQQVDSLSVATCDSSNKYESFKFTGSGTNPGQLMNTATGLCIDATCASVSTGCVPLKEVQCVANDKNQQFIYKSDKSFESVGTAGGCLDLWGGGGPEVGVYGCNGGANQHWEMQGTTIKSDADGNLCLVLGGTPVWVYSNADSVELFVNGATQGKKQNPTLSHVQWNVQWVAGSIEARGYDKSGKVVKNEIIETTGSPSAVVLTVEYGSKGINADKQDVALIQATIVDSKNRIVPTASNKITFSVNNLGMVIGVGNGDPSSHEPDKSNSRSAFNGYARVIVQSTDQPGVIEVTASSPGLQDGKVSFNSMKPSQYVRAI